MMKLNRIVALLLILLLLTHPAALAQGKEEIIYGMLDASGRVSTLWAVNRFPAGAATDWGDYRSASLLSADAELRLHEGYVTFSSAQEGACYQGELTDRTLPWHLEASWLVNGQAVSPSRLAGCSGTVEFRLSVSKNTDCPGAHFETHALQVTAQLDPALCRLVSAPAALETTINGMRSLTWTLLPGMENTVSFCVEAEHFAMPAITLHAVRPDETTLARQRSLQSLSGEGQTLRTQALTLVSPALDQANQILTTHRQAFDALGVRLNTLTVDNYQAEVLRIEDELMAQAGDSIRWQAQEAAEADNSSAELEKSIRRQVEAEVRAEMTASLPRVPVQGPSEEAVEQAVAQQLQTREVQYQIDLETATQMNNPQVQQQLDSQLDAIIRPQVEAAVRQQVESAVTSAMAATVRQGAEAALRVQLGADILQELLQGLSTDTDLSQSAEVLAQVEALVNERMASAQVQAQLDALTAQAMEAQETQAIIALQIDQQMNSPEVRSAIDAQVAQQLADPNVRTQAEEALRQQIRAQVTEAVRDQLRIAVRSQWGAANTPPSVDEMMDDDDVQIRIDQEIARQIAQSQTGQLNLLHHTIALLKEKERSTEAYEALIALRAAADEAVAFYAELTAYTQDVDELSASAAVSGAPTISFTSEKNGPVDRVEFVLTFPAVTLPRTAPAPAEEEPTLLEQLLSLLP